VVVAVAVFLAVFPGPVYWLSDQTNLRYAKWWGRRGYTQTLDKYDAGLRLLRIGIPIFLVLLAISVFLGGWF
jgi:hypothetical protein